MAIWIRNREGDFVTAYTVTYNNETFILTDEENDALAEYGPVVADGTIREQDAIRDFLRGIGVSLD